MSKLQIKKDIRSIEILSITQGALFIMLFVSWKIRSQLSQMTAPADAQSILSQYQTFATVMPIFILAAIGGFIFWSSKIKTRVLAAIPEGN